jgi:hypothetical protein
MSAATGRGAAPCASPAADAHFGRAAGVLAFVLIAALPAAPLAFDRGVNQPGALGNPRADPGLNQPGAVGNVGRGAPGPGVAPGVGAPGVGARDPGINQPGAVGNVGRGGAGVGAPGIGTRDPGLNQPGVAGNVGGVARRSVIR